MRSTSQCDFFVDALGAGGFVGATVTARAAVDMAIAAGGGRITDAYDRDLCLITRAMAYGHHDDGDYEARGRDLANEIEAKALALREQDSD